jgi:hypothetical protein
MDFASLRINGIMVKTLSSILALSLLFVCPAWSADDLDKLEEQRCPKPKQIALVFSMGYAADHMPADDDRFAALLDKLKEAGFSVIHCTYTDKRLELCKKHGMQMMVDLLAKDEHVYNAPEKARALCEKLKDDPTVWGYNIWNDPMGKSAEGRHRDVNNVRTWDPSHPAFVGTYRTDGMTHLANAELLGYYDFHWKRGLPQHFGHLLAYNTWARERDAWFYTWLSATSGQAGKGNFNRCLWSANTSIACGLKGILWFLGNDLIDMDKLEWTERGRDIIKVQKEIAPLTTELARLGNPVHIWSTPVTRSPNNEPLPKAESDTIPPGLEKSLFPDDAWLQSVKGEFLAGIFEESDKGAAAFIANHNAYADQGVVLKINKATAARKFDRATSTWKALEIKDGTISLTLSPAAAELLRVEFK